MIALLQQPNKVSFSRNPIIFEFETDSLYAELGRPYRAIMQFNETKKAGSSFSISWRGVTLVFDFVTELTANNGRELPAYQSGDVTDWLDELIAAFNLNYYVESGFRIEKHSNGFSLVFISKENSADFNITYNGITGMSGVTWSTVDYAQDRLLRRNFALYLELWVEREDRTGFDRYSQSTVEVDNAGVAIWDVQRYLTSILLQHGPILPDVNSDQIVVDDRSVRQYYIRYAEMYGDPQRIARVYQTETFIAVLGGFGNDFLHRHLPDYFLGPFGEINWLSGFAIQNLHINQPGYGAIVNLKEDYANVAVKCRLFFDDRLEEEYILFDLSEWKQNSKLVVPVGFINKLSSFTDRRNISNAIIWVESAGTRVSGNLEIAFRSDIVPAFMPMLYLNSYGCFQTVYTYGKRTFVYNIEKTSEAFMSSVRPSPMSHSLRELGIKTRDGIKVNSGYFSRPVIQHLRDFMLSSYKYVYLEDRWRPVVLDSNSIEESEDFENLQAIGFTLLFANEDYVWST